MDENYCICTNSGCYVEPKVFSTAIDVLKHFPSKCKIITLNELMDFDHSKILDLHLDEQIDKANDLISRVQQDFKELIIKFSSDIHKQKFVIQTSRIKINFEGILKQTQILHAIKNKEIKFLVESKADLSILVDKEKMDIEFKNVNNTLNQIHQEIIDLQFRIMRSFDVKDQGDQQSGQIKNLMAPILSPTNLLKDSLLCTTEKQAIQMGKWIGQKIYSSKLLYRGSRDGFSTQTFLERCEGMKQTLVLVKSKEGQKIFGGFTQLVWDIQPQGWIHKRDDEAFVFSLTQQTKHELYKYHDNAICRYYTSSGEKWAPCFGGFGQWIYDIIISDQCNQNALSQSDLGFCYRSPEGMVYGSIEAQNYLAGSHKFTVEEIEVFQILNE